MPLAAHLSSSRGTQRCPIYRLWLLSHGIPHWRYDPNSVMRLYVSPLTCPLSIFRQARCCARARHSSWRHGAHPLLQRYDCFACHGVICSLLTCPIDPALSLLDLEYYSFLRELELGQQLHTSCRSFGFYYCEWCVRASDSQSIQRAEVRLVLNSQ